MAESYRIYVEPVARKNLFEIQLNLPREVEIVWAWDVRGAEDKSRESGFNNLTTRSLASGFAATKAEAHKEAEKWADALSQKAEYTYTPKKKSAPSAPPQLTESSNDSTS